MGPTRVAALSLNTPRVYRILAQIKGSARIKITILLVLTWAIVLGLSMPITGVFLWPSKFGACVSPYFSFYVFSCSCSLFASGYLKGLRRNCAACFFPALCCCNDVISMHEIRHTSQRNVWFCFIPTFFKLSCLALCCFPWRCWRRLNILEQLTWQSLQTGPTPCWFEGDRWFLGACAV